MLRPLHPPCAQWSPQQRRALPRVCVRVSEQAAVHHENSRDRRNGVVASVVSLQLAAEQLKQRSDV